MSNFRLVSWNVNGIRAAGRKGLIAELQKLSPSIVCLQETKAHPEQVSPELITLDGRYSSEFASAQKRGYSGVATFYPTNTKPKLKTNWGFSLSDEEGRLVQTSFKNLTVINAYFPSGTTGDVRQTEKYKFLDFISETIKSMPKQKRENLLLCGDFNICRLPIDIHHPKEAEKRKLSGFLKEEREWFAKFLEENNLTDTFRFIHPQRKDIYSWWTYRAGAKSKNLGWRIDYILTSKALEQSITDAEIYPEFACSDHCPISVDLDITL